MKKFPFKTLLVLVLGLTASFMIMTNKERPRPRPVVEAVPPKVSVITVTPATQHLQVKTQGTVTPRREINIVSQVSGKVVSVSDDFAPGGFFNEGKILVDVEDQDYQFALIRAEAKVADSEEKVALEKGQALQAKREWRDLGTKSANKLFLREPQLKSAEANLAAARADLSAAEIDLQRTKIRAPFNGRIAEKHVDEGQYLSVGNTIAKVYSTDVAQVRLPLTDRQVALLDLPLNYADGSNAAPPAKVTIKANFGGQEWQWQGQIVRTDSSIDLDSRVIYAVAEIENPFDRDPNSNRPPLAIGLFVEAEIEGRELSNVITLPRNVLRSDGSLLLVDSDDRIFYQQAQVVKTDQYQAWITGLPAGTRVVASHLPAAVTGMQVTASELVQLVEGNH